MDTKNKPIKILQWNIGGLRNHLPFFLRTPFSSFHEHLNSDHSALIITIEIPRMNSPPYQPKWNTHKANWGRFQKLIEIWASSYQIGDKT